MWECDSQSALELLRHHAFESTDAQAKSKASFFFWLYKTELSLMGFKETWEQNSCNNDLTFLVHKGGDPSFECFSGNLRMERFFQKNQFLCRLVAKQGFQSRHCAVLSWGLCGNCISCPECIFLLIMVHLACVTRLTILAQTRSCIVFQ